MKKYVDSWNVLTKYLLQPYITKHIFSTPKPPVKLRKIAIGDGSLGSLATVEELPAVCPHFDSTGILNPKA